MTMAADAPGMVPGAYTVPADIPPPPVDYRPAAATLAEVPVIDFDGEVRIIARVRIAGELFDIPAMPAAAMGWYARIVNEPMDDPSTAYDMVVEFIVRCVATVDRERCRAAIIRSDCTMATLMEQGGKLMSMATGFPLGLSARSPSPPSTSGGSSTVGASTPGSPGWPASPPGN